MIAPCGRWLVLAVLLVGCHRHQEAAGPHAVGTEVVEDGEARIGFDFGYDDAPPGQLDFVVQMRGLGIEEMDKIVVDVDPDGFVVIEGTAEWNGFVAPRQKQSHRVALRAREDADAHTVTVTVRRSMDSTLLLQKTFGFDLQDGKVIPR